jgi:hypothetical protein
MKKLWRKILNRWWGRYIVLPIIITVISGSTWFIYSYFHEETVKPVDSILIRWNLPENGYKSWNPFDNKGRSDIIIETARAANEKFLVKELKEFETDDLDRPSYVMLTFDEDLLSQKTLTFSQKNAVKLDSKTEVNVQKRDNETWSAFYERGFKELVSFKPQPTPKAESRKSLSSAKPKAKVEKDDEDGGIPTLDQEDADTDEISKLLNFQIFFSWEPEIDTSMALQYHPYVVEGLDKVILFAASNLGLNVHKLLKLDVEDFNSPGNKIILIYSPEGLKAETVKFIIRIISLDTNKADIIQETFLLDMKRKKGEDWNEFYTRGLCQIAKKAKIIKECKLQYQ